MNRRMSAFRSRWTASPTWVTPTPGTTQPMYPGATSGSTKQCRASPAPLRGSNSHSTPLRSRTLRSRPKLSATRDRAPSAPARNRQVTPDAVPEPASVNGIRPGVTLSKGSPKRTSAPARPGLIDEMAEEPGGVRGHEEVVLALEVHEPMFRVVDAHAADPADQRGRRRPLLPGLLHQYAGRVDVLAGLGFPVQHQHGEAALRRPPGAGEPREAGAHDDEIVVGGLPRRSDGRQRPVRRISRKLGIVMPI